MRTIAEQLGIKEFPFEIFDKNGNKIYFESPDGHWEKREYDSNGSIIYYESSNDYWSKRKYDSNGNQIYYENSDGFWVKKEFDSKSNEIYFENSRGLIKDNRNIPEYTMEELIEKLGNFKLKINYGK